MQQHKSLGKTDHKAGDVSDRCSIFQIKLRKNGLKNVRDQLKAGLGCGPPSSYKKIGRVPLPDILLTEGGCVVVGWLATHRPQGAWTDVRRTPLLTTTTDVPRDPRQIDPKWHTRTYLVGLIPFLGLQYTVFGTNYLEFDYKYQ